MGKTTKHQQLILLESDSASILDKLAVRTRIPKQVLLREAVEDLLAKHEAKASELYDDLRTVLTDARALANTAAILGDDEARQRAARIRHVIDSVQDAFDRNWRIK